VLPGDYPPRSICGQRDQSSTASAATGCHTQFSVVILTIGLLSVAPPRFAPGTVLVARLNSTFAQSRLRHAPVYSGT